MSNFRIVTKQLRNGRTDYCIEYLEFDKWIQSYGDCYDNLKDCEGALNIVIESHMKDGVAHCEYTYYNNKGEKV